MIRTDLTFALCQMRRTPIFSIVAVATLALGIGVNSAIFALADAALLRPLPFSDSDRRRPRHGVRSARLAAGHDRHLRRARVHRAAADARARRAHRARGDAVERA